MTLTVRKALEEAIEYARESAPINFQFIDKWQAALDADTGPGGDEVEAAAQQAYAVACAQSSIEPEDWPKLSERTRREWCDIVRVCQITTPAPDSGSVEGQRPAFPKSEVTTEFLMEVIDWAEDHINETVCEIEPTHLKAIAQHALSAKPGGAFDEEETAKALWGADPDQIDGGDGWNDLTAPDRDRYRQIARATKPQALTQWRSMESAPRDTIDQFDNCLWNGNEITTETGVVVGGVPHDIPESWGTVLALGPAALKALRSSTQLLTEQLRFCDEGSSDATRIHNQRAINYQLLDDVPPLPQGGQ